MAEKITDTRNAARPNSARATGTRSAGGTSLACDNLSGWPVSPRKVHFVTYQLNSSSAPVAGTQLDCSGIVTGNTINSITVIDGNDVGNSVNDVVEMIPTAAWGQDLTDALTTQHNRDGTHAGITATSITTTGNATVGGNETVAGTLAVTGATTLTGTTTIVALYNPYKFSVYRNAAANTGNNTFGLITFDTKEFDTSTNYDTSTGKFTIPVAGFYQFNFGSGFNAAAGFCVLALFKNGAEVKRGMEIVSAGATDTQLVGSTLIQLAATDYLQVYVQSPGANALQTGANRNYFSGFLVSAS